MNLRERKKARTRDALGRAATRLYLERGFEGTTIEDIVEEAGVSRRTFFRYFPTKEAAFFADHAERMARFTAEVALLRGGLGPWRGVCEALLRVAGGYEDDVASSLAWHRALRASPTLLAHDLQIDSQWEALVCQELVSGGFPPRRAAVAAGALMGVVRATLQRWYDHECAYSLVESGREAVAMLEEGIHRASPA